MDRGSDVLSDRIRGGLYGAAAGDALGGTTEFMSPGEIRAKHGWLTEMIGGGVWNLTPGEVTDDTMMTLCVAEGILEAPQDPFQAIGMRFLAWYASNPKDTGNIIRHVFGVYAGDWFDAARKTHDDFGGKSAGNGSLMRCLPAALAYADPVMMEQVTRLQSQMTHHDPMAAEACVLYNRIAHRLLRGELLEAAMRDVLAGTPYADALEGEPSCEPTGYVADTFRWVIHHLLAGTDYADVVQRAANRGGDSDTVAAIAGGLAGIHYGYDGIPARYREAILIRERLDAAAEGLLTLRLGRVM